MSFKVKILLYSYVLNSNLPSMLMPQGYHLFSKPLISHPHLTFLCLFFVNSLSIVNIVEGVFFVHRFSCSGFLFLLLFLLEASKLILYCQSCFLCLRRLQINVDLFFGFLRRGLPLFVRRFLLGGWGTHDNANIDSINGIVKGTAIFLTFVKPLRVCVPIQVLNYVNCYKYTYSNCLHFHTTEL